MPFTEDELRQVFTALDAEDVEGWVKSELKEGIPQLHRFLFLAKAWSAVPSEKDHGWIDRSISAVKDDPSLPFGGAGVALERLRALGADDADLTELVRAQMAEMLFHVCYLLDDSGYVPDERYLDPAIKPVLDRVDWGLFATDEEGEPVELIGGAHESVLHTDPMHREVMAPRFRDPNRVDVH